jgi:hypothetical protein
METKKAFKHSSEKDLKKRAPAETSWSFLFCKEKKWGRLKCGAGPILEK